MRFMRKKAEKGKKAGSWDMALFAIKRNMETVRMHTVKKKIHL